MNRIRYLMPRNVLLNLYYSFIYPYLSQCNLVWASNYPYRLKGLSVFQWRAMQMVAGRTDNMDTAYCFYKWNILTFPLINKYQISTSMFRNEHKLLPPIFNNYFKSYADCHSYFTRAQETFIMLLLVQIPGCQPSNVRYQRCGTYSLCTYVLRRICHYFRKRYVNILQVICHRLNTEHMCTIVQIS